MKLATGGKFGWRVHQAETSPTPCPSTASCGAGWGMCEPCVGGVWGLSKVYSKQFHTLITPFPFIWSNTKNNSYHHCEFRDKGWLVIFLNLATALYLNRKLYQLHSLPPSTSPPYPNNGSSNHRFMVRWTRRRTCGKVKTTAALRVSYKRFKSKLHSFFFVG